MKSILLVIFGLCTLSLFGQFGVHASYLDAQPDEWRTAEENPVINLPGTGWDVGLDYWFRLKNTRIEFLPTLAYSRRGMELGLRPAAVSATVQAVGFFFSTDFYLLDLKGDCDCPTFSKQGPAIQKGLYLQLSPGISYFNFELADQRETLKDSDFNLNMGGALGIDIGISDAVTLSPYAGLRYYPQLEWASLGPPATTAFQFSDQLQPQADVLEYQFGLRVGLRVD